MRFVDRKAKQFNRRVCYGFFQTTHKHDVPTRIAEFVDSRSTQHPVNLMAVTGDLAATGFGGDLGFARGYFLSTHPPRSSVGITNLPNLGLPQDRLFVMPGNHDRYKFSGTYVDKLSDGIGPGGERFEEYFQENWTCFKGQYDRVASIEVPDTPKERPPIYLVAADFCLYRKEDAEHWRLATLGYAGQGRVTCKILGDLIKETERVRTLSGKAVVIWLLHFPPFTLSELEPKERNLRLIGAEKIKESAKQNAVGLILSGHLHRHHATSGPENVKVWCADGAAIMSVRPHRIYEICISFYDNRSDFVRAERLTYALGKDRELGPGFYRDPVSPDVHHWRFVPR